MAHTPMIENGDRWRPDHALGAEVLLISWSVEEQAHRHEVFDDETAYNGIGIRHGIQRMAACSMLFSKIS